MAEEETGLDDLVEEAISQKKNVKDILVEMKDTSELMVDLAYSSLLTNSKEIAEIVQDLEQYMDDLQYEIGAKLLLSARTTEDAADLSGILRVANSAEDIADAAENIVDVVVRGVGDHPIYRSFLEETEEKVARMKVEGESPLASKTLGEYRLLTETGCFVRAIRRKGKWIYNPEKTTMVKPKDVLIVLGTENSIDKLRSICEG